MVQRFLTILLVSFLLHLVFGPEAVARTTGRPEATIRFRTCLAVNKPFKQDLKVQHTISVRCRVPQVCKSAYSRNLQVSGSLPAPVPCSNDSSRSAPAGADSAYILGLIYPFHGFL
ncbi:MAG TPA: hypothetical protein VGE15_03180 [Sphingobacteriaceae bacterium]